MFYFSFREMVKWYDDSKDNIDLFENDSQCIAGLKVPLIGYETHAFEHMNDMKGNVLDICRA